MEIRCAGLGCSEEVKYIDRTILKPANGQAEKYRRSPSSAMPCSTASCSLLKMPAICGACRLPVKGADASQAGRRNLLYGKPVVERSGEVNASERAEYATDEDVSTKWCDYSDAKPKLLGVDLGRETTIRGWYVMHAALESLDYITKEYSLQVRQSPGEEWKTVDTVYDNTAFETDRILPEPIIARYVRLVVSKPDQSEGNTARIYEFEVY